MKYFPRATKKLRVCGYHQRHKLTVRENSEEGLMCNAQADQCYKYYFNI